MKLPSQSVSPEQAVSMLFSSDYDDMTCGEFAVTYPLQARADRAELERRRDMEAKAAEDIVYSISRHEEIYTGGMAEAVAHATLAAYYQARIEWEYGAGG